LILEVFAMRSFAAVFALLALAAKVGDAGEQSAGARVIAKPDAFPTLVNPACSHCRDEAKRRAADLKDDDRVLCWLRGYSEGGVIPIRFFLNPYRVISDSYGVFVYDPDAGFARGFTASYDFRFHGWRNGVMVMKHKDGTLYSSLTGVAFEGPKTGNRLEPLPTLVSDWGFWFQKYPGAVAYQMFDKYQPVALPQAENADAVKSRGKPDPRLKADQLVLGVWTGKMPRAYPIQVLEKTGFLQDDVGGESLIVVWESRTRSASAYRPVASQPRTFKGPRPGPDGVSPPDDGIPIPADAPPQKPRKVTLSPSKQPAQGALVDGETQSTWDIAGRCVAGELKGWTLQWVDSVQVKWFAWSAEYPQTTVHGAEKPATPGPDQAAKEVAGTAEFLRVLPKPFATVKAVDLKNRTVALLLDGEKVAKVWPVEPDAEMRVGGWWGRLEQFKPGDRVWVWLKLDRKKNAVSVVMLADEISEFDFHGSLRKKPESKPPFTAEQIESQRTEQRAWLRKRWLDEGLPGTLTFHHVFSGELEVFLDHEAMRWGRSLRLGDIVHLSADPPIKGVVKAVTPWRERTVVRVVVGELESSELKMGQRLGMKVTPPPETVENSPYPPDLDRPRSKAERIEWFLASTYCACGVKGDICTGHFYTLASCNPNGCGMPNQMRQRLAKMIDGGSTDREIFDTLLKEFGPLVLRSHLAP
jgi:hypothetical protein